MKQYRVGVRRIFLLAVVLCLPNLALGSEEVGQIGDARWRGKDVLISVSRSIRSSPNIQGDFFESLRQASRLWSEAADLQIKIVESDLDSASPKGNRGDGISLITSSLTPENIRLFPKRGASPAAVTRLFIDLRNNITEADIVLNPFVRFSTDGSFDTFDLQDTLTHELGHLLGLRHSPAWSSIMYGRSVRSFGPASFSGLRKDLPMADISAIKGKYGARPEDAECCGSVVGRVRDSSPGKSTTVWMEESSTGRLIAATVPDDDGRYRIDGLAEGNYAIFAAGDSGPDQTASTRATVSVSIGDETTKELPLRYERVGFGIPRIGNSFRLAELAVNLKMDSRELFVGVPTSLVDVLSPRLSGGPVLEPYLSNSFSFSSSVKVLSFGLPRDFTPVPGEYTLIIENSAGIKRYLLGSIVVPRGEPSL